MSKPGRTESLLDALSHLPLPAKWRRRVTTARDAIRGVRMLRAWWRGDDGEE